MSKKTISERSGTDLARLDAMSDDDIDFSDCPPASADDFARGVLRKGLKPIPKKVQLTIRIDADVLEWYKSLGTGYQTTMNALLRAYMKAHQAHKPD